MRYVVGLAVVLILLAIATNIEAKERRVISHEERIAKIARTAILENGGRMELRDDKPVYIINCDF